MKADKLLKLISNIPSTTDIKIRKRNTSDIYNFELDDVTFYSEQGEFHIEVDL